MEYTKPSVTCSKKRSTAGEQLDPAGEQLPLFDADASLEEIEAEGVDWRTDHARQRDHANLLRGNRKPRKSLPDREAHPHGNYRE